MYQLKNKYLKLLYLFASNVHIMVKLFGFLIFCGNSLCGIAKKLSPILTKASPCNSLLLMHNSLKNSYLGTCLMASKIGLFISTFLKVSNTSFSCSSFINLQRKGRGVLKEVETLNVTFGANFSFVNSAFSSAEFFSSRSSSFSGALYGHSSNCSSLSKVTSLTLDRRLISV